MTIHARLPNLTELFDHLADVIAWAKDRAGVYVWVNRAFLANYQSHDAGGGARDDDQGPLGKTDYDFSPAFLADQYRIDDLHVLEGRRLVNRIEQVGRPGEVAVWNVTNKIPLIDAAGAIVGTAGFTRRLLDSLSEARADGEFAAVLSHMRDHFHEPISNGELARLAHLSVRAFERKFAASFHLTPQKYLRQLQLRMATRAMSTRTSAANFAGTTAARRASIASTTRRRIPDAGFITRIAAGVQALPDGRDTLAFSGMLLSTMVLESLNVSCHAIPVGRCLIARRLGRLRR